jgi:hypothetical protein
MDKLKDLSIGLPKYTVEGFVEFDVRNVILDAAADASVTLYLLKPVTGGMI